MVGSPEYAQVTLVSAPQAEGDMVDLPAVLVKAPKVVGRSAWGPESSPVLCSRRDVEPMPPTS